jgi:hypothetical protein
LAHAGRDVECAADDRPQFRAPFDDEPSAGLGGHDVDAVVREVTLLHRQEIAFQRCQLENLTQDSLPKNTHPFLDRLPFLLRRVALE